jgi:hypothetical protein
MFHQDWYSHYQLHRQRQEQAAKAAQRHLLTQFQTKKVQSVFQVALQETKRTLSHLRWQRTQPEIVTSATENLVTS